VALVSPIDGSAVSPIPRQTVQREGGSDERCFQHGRSGTQRKQRTYQYQYLALIADFFDMATAIPRSAAQVCLLSLVLHGSGRESFHLGTIRRSQDECRVGAHRTLSRDWDLNFGARSKNEEGRLEKMGWNGRLSAKGSGHRGKEHIQDAILGVLCVTGEYSWKYCYSLLNSEEYVRGMVFAKQRVLVGRCLGWMYIYRCPAV
jgi:hypothetical protein